MSILPEPPELSDGVIRLRLIRVLGPDDADARPRAAQFIARAPEYRFAIQRCEDDARVGRIHLRVTNDAAILRAIGHFGYEIDEAHRRQGYAARAVALVRELARQTAVAPLWVLIAPDNIASRRTVERAGFLYVDTVDASPEALALDVAPALCRYVVDDDQHR